MWKGAIVGDSGNVALLSHGQFRSFLAFRTDHEAKNHRRSWQTQMATRRDARTPTQNAPSISSRCAHKPFIFPTSKTLINQTNSTHFSAFTRSPVSQRKYFEKNSTFQAPKTASRIFQKKNRLKSNIVNISSNKLNALPTQFCTSTNDYGRIVTNKVISWSSKVVDHFALGRLGAPKVIFVPVTCMCDEQVCVYVTRQPLSTQRGRSQATGTETHGSFDIHQTRSDDSR